MSASSQSRRGFEVRLLAWLAACISVFSFLYYFRRGEVLLYGDAVAHINIARRVFDSKTPGLLQLGTVWLPLPHLVMIPFLLSDRMWQTGAGGSIPSMLAYVFSVVGIFRLVRGALQPSSDLANSVRLAAWAAAGVFALNPNVIYLQATAMGEVLYLALFIWSVVYFSEFVRGSQKALLRCAWCLLGACLTRYDGWFLTCVIGASVLLIFFYTRKASQGTSAPREAFSRSNSSLIRFVLVAAFGPVLWLAYNGIVYRNPLEFENGPYSAKAIERRTQSAGSPGHPGSGSLVVSGLYFLKSAEFTMAENVWLHRLWILLGLVGLGILTLAVSRRHAPGARSGSPWVLLFLLVPLPFYALSVAYGGVPIFVPAWWPFSHYNVRYGLQFMPAFATALGVVVYDLMRSDLWIADGRLKRVAIVVLLAVVSLSYVSVWQAGPICYTEAIVNMRGKVALERQVANWLHALPSDSTLLMYLGEHPGTVEQAGIPLKRTINEGNHRVWIQPRDPDGLWERALADPARYVDYVLAFEGDEVWQAVQGRHFKELVEINVTGQRRGILYRTR